MSNAAKVIEIARGELGYKEKATNASLDLATANAGTGNWTKYARDLYAAGYYNGNKNGYAWCDVFVDWVFYKAFGKTEGQMTECQTGELGAACPYSAGYYKAQGRYDRTPRVGDQVFFQEGGALVHTGIVVAVSGNAITTIEGNKSNMVKECTYSLSNSYVAGFGHPKYDEQAPAAPAVTGGSPYHYGPMVFEDTSLHQLSVGSYGPEVKHLQRTLYARGYKGADGKAISVDGDFGKNTETAVKKMQGELGLTQDGVAGKETLMDMMTRLW